MHDEKALNKLEESAYKELEKIVEKDLTPQTLSLAKELLCILKDIPEVKGMHHMDDGMMESGYRGYNQPRYYDIASYDNYSYDNGMSERRGRSPMSGRFMSYDDGRMSGTHPMSMNMSGNNQIQPDMVSMMSQMMDRLDRLEKK